MNEQIIENIERIARHFGFELDTGRKCYTGKCPIHEGDNPTALNLYYVGENSVGNWICNTHHCHHHFGQNTIGFIRGLLSVRNYNWQQKGDKESDFVETVEWLRDFLGIQYKSNQLDENVSISRNINKLYTEHFIPKSFEITEQQYRDSGLTFPSNYFLDRGYDVDTLNYFGIGYCDNPQKSMYTRSVVPLHNINGDKIIGCLGRSNWNKCEICKGFHNPNNLCPPKDMVGIYSKWKNSPNYPGAFSLYNFHRAQPEIQKTGLAIITEGAPNVWRLHEAGFPMSVSCNSNKFSSHQKNILDLSGANTIVIVPDAGRPGKMLVEKVIEQCKNCYNIVTIEPSYEDDIGDCNINTVKEILLPFVEKYKV